MSHRTCCRYHETGGRLARCFVFTLTEAMKIPSHAMREPVAAGGSVCDARAAILRDVRFADKPAPHRLCQDVLDALDARLIVHHGDRLYSLTVSGWAALARLPDACDAPDPTAGCPVLCPCGERLAARGGVCAECYADQDHD